MPPAAGLGSQWGLAKETTFGTAVTPTKFYEYDSGDFALEQNYQDGVGLRANRTFQPSGQMRLTTRSAGGSVPMDVPTKLFGSILDLMHGATPTVTQQAATTAYLQTHPIGTTVPNKSATMQINKPLTTATDHPVTYPGSILLSAAFSCEADGKLKVTLGWWSQDERNLTTTPAGLALATASYATGTTSWIGTDSGTTLTMGGSTVAIAKSWSLSFTQPYRVDRAYLGSGGLMAKPIPNGLTQVTGSVNVEWAAATHYDQFRAGTPIAIVADFQGATIASTYKEQIKFTVSAAQPRGSSPAVDGPDLLDMEIPYVAGDNGSAAPLQIEYMSTDTAV